MTEPASAPMGRLDAFDVGPKKLTVQTEFFSRPAWRFETKIYLAGELKKVYTEDVSAVDESDLQRQLNEYLRLINQGSTYEEAMRQAGSREIAVGSWPDCRARPDGEMLFLESRRSIARSRVRQRRTARGSSRRCGSRSTTNTESSGAG